MKMLEVRDMSVSYGNIKVIKNVSFSVAAGEIVAIIGANGSGKSSLLKAASGLVPYSGIISFKGTNLNKIPAHKIVGLGMAHVPEGRGIFDNLTVKENLLLATWQRKDKAGIRKDLEAVLDQFPRLRERLSQYAGTLSGGEQQMLAIARALMSRAEMLLLDEPSMGLSPLLTQEIFRMLEKINRKGTTILLVEQNARMALDLASRGFVIQNGSVIMSGNSRELADNPQIQEAYLGG
jgi:branched-chain amino acid transport system ATP-binding protein